MLMTNVCNCRGCQNPTRIRENYKVLDNEFKLYTFKVDLCLDCFEFIYEIKEKVTGDFSVFFKKPIKKLYY